MQFPATLSASIIARVIRAPDAIGFGGVLVTDDLVMHALTGSPGERAAAALQAGCDVALHCSGVLADTRSVLDAVPAATPACLARLSAARAMAEAACRSLDGAALADERAGLLA